MPYTYCISVEEDKEDMKELILEITERNKILFVSENHYATLGYLPEELLDQQIEYLTHPEERNLQEIFELKKNTSRATNLCRFRHKDGNFLYFEQVIHFYQNETGENRIVIISNQISELETSKLSQFNFSNSNKYNIFAVTDPLGKISYANNSFCAICNYNLEELIGQDHRIVNSKYHTVEFFQSIYANFSKNEIWRGEIRNKSKNGTIYWLDTILVPVRDRENKLSHILGIRTDITERKQLEQSNILTAVFEYTPIMMAVLDTKFNFLYVNQAYADTGKLPVSYFAGKNHFALYPNEENQKIFQTVIDTGEPFFIKEKPFKYPDQPERGITYWDWSLVPNKNTNGKVQNLIFTLQESTERVHSQSTLQKIYNEIAQRQFIIDEHAIVAITNLAGTITYVNRRFCEISQYSKDELLGKNHRMINSGYHDKEFFKDMYRTLKKGRVWHGEIRNQAKDGSYYWVETSIAPMKNMVGKNEKYFAIRTDITERKRIELELKQSERKYKDLHNNNPLMIFTLSKDAIILDVNPITFQELGYEPEEIIGNPVFKVFHPDEHGKVLQKFQDFLENPAKSPPWEFRKITKHGKVIWVSETVQFMLDQRNEPIIILVCENITERKWAEDVLNKYMRELENLNKAKTKFFSIIAHDLCNPFAGILGIAELLEIKLQNSNELSVSQCLHYSKLIHTSAKSGFTLLENLMQWALTQSGNIEYNPRRLSIATQISQAISVVTSNAFNKNISIEYDKAENQFVYADEILLNTVLRNLLTNAIKFTHKSGKIRVSTRIENNILLVSISDTGIGIDPMNLEKIFRIDTRFSNTGTNKEKGTGLGLILCKEFVEKQGGTIWVESELGQGSTFTFTLPLVNLNL